MIQNVQVDEARFPDIGRDELGSHLNRVQEKRQIACRCSTQTKLLSQDMPARRKNVNIDVVACMHFPNAHLVSVMRSVLGISCSDIMQVVDSDEIEQSKGNRIREERR